MFRALLRLIKPISNRRDFYTLIAAHQRVAERLLAENVQLNDRISSYAALLMERETLIAQLERRVEAQPRDAISAVVRAV